jgi:tetratricopeptide (TPR) repeat protein
VGGWIVALVLLGGASVLGFVVAKPYLMHGTKPSASLAPLDPKAQQLLSDGERAFTQGNLDVAKEDFDKASVLADKDPRVLLDVAQVAEARADVGWLGARLATVGEAQTRARKELDELSVRSSAAADAALAATPDDPAAVRSKIDALRIAGDLAQARALVAKMTTSSLAGQPQTEYVLAALDLAEPATPTTQVIERLRDAVNSEESLGRARAALVYALARMGDAAGARRELEKLLSLPRQHPLQSELRAFVDHATQAATGDAGTMASVDINALPGGGSSNPGYSAADPRSLNQQADAARARGDYAKAKELYGRVLVSNPSDSEALAGLGDCSYAQRDLENAKTYYRYALDANNTYTPALIGLADTLWDTGDHAGAQKMYKDIIDRLPETMVPARAKTRVNEGGGAAATATTTTAATATATTSATTQGGGT